MKDLPDKLNSIGVERRFALDIGSVIAGIRPRGLMHIPVEQKNSLEQILIQYGLIIEAQRALYRQNDSNSREGILLDSCDDDSATEWCEIWYSHPTATRVNAEKLFLNTGEFLGYPPCCRKSMQTENALAKLFYRYIFTDKDRFWELNRLATIFHHTILMPDFFPCSLSCSSALSYVIPFHDLAKGIFPSYEYIKTKKQMCSPITVIGDEIVHWSKWHIEESILEVDVNSAKKEKIKKITALYQNNDTSSALLLSFRNNLFPQNQIRPNQLHIILQDNNIANINLLLC